LNQVFITDGDLISAIRASSCYPGMFEPLQYRGRTLADGGIVNNLPVEAVAFLDATYTIASDTTPPRRLSYVDPNSEGHWWERFMATVRFERRNPMAQMLMRSSDSTRCTLPIFVSATSCPTYASSRFGRLKRLWLWVKGQRFRPFRILVC
jgi:predicted acylesterase/phospholipase RssA